MTAGVRTSWGAGDETDHAPAEIASQELSPGGNPLEYQTASDASKNRFTHICLWSAASNPVTTFTSKLTCSALCVLPF